MILALLTFGAAPPQTSLNVPIQLTVPRDQMLALRLFGAGPQD